MRHRRASGLRTAVAAGLATAAILVFTLARAALAGHTDGQIAAAATAVASADTVTAAAGGAAAVAQNPPRCGKCHNVCEQGRIHEGRPALTPAAALPLTTEGRVTCSTCHEPHRDGESARSARLRLSNLRRELCLSCHGRQADETPNIEIVSPPDGAFAIEERLALIGKATHLPEELLAVTLNGAEFQLHLRGEEFSTWLTLREGLNHVQLSQGGRVLWSGEIFHAETAPAGYERTTSSHGTATREQCRGCHDQAGRRIVSSGGDAAGLCYGCHDRFGGKRYLHGPLGVGACLACHDPHGGYGPAHLRSEQGALCGTCHAPRDLATRRPCAARGKSCGECHDPHQSNARYLLKGPQYSLRQTSVGRP